jgi:transposase
MESVIETKEETIRDLLRGVSGSVHVALEEGTQAAWLYEIVRPLVSEVIVCDPRANKALMAGNKGDRIDAHKIAQQLRAGLLKPVYHGGQSTRTLKELVHNYDCVVSDNVRVMSRLKALFRGRGIPCAGRGIYDAQSSDKWLAMINEPGARSRASFLYQELSALKQIRRDSKKLLLSESERHQAAKLLSSIPGIGSVRAAVIVGTVSTPHRFRTRRQFWTYCGFSVVTRSSSDYKFEGAKLVRHRKRVSTRGLNRNFNRRLKAVFKGAVQQAIKQEPFKSYWEQLKARNVSIAIARVSVARKLASVTLAVWKNLERFDVEKHKPSPEL